MNAGQKRSKHRQWKVNRREESLGSVGQMSEEGVSSQGGRLAKGNAIRERNQCVERTCEGLIVLTQSEEGRRLRVVGCLYWMRKQPLAGCYVYDGTGVNRLRLLGPVPDIMAQLHALTRMGVRVLSLIEQRCGWDERSECMSLSWCRPPSIRDRKTTYK